MLDGFVLPNALSWSPDDRSMYFADTHNQVIWVFDYDLTMARSRTGASSGLDPSARPSRWRHGGRRRLCMELHGRHRPAGAPGAGRPRGPRDPAASHHPDLPAFGGAGLDTLYITSHSQRLTPEKLALEPLAGGLFALNVGVKGLPEPRYRG